MLLKMHRNRKIKQAWQELSKVAGFKNIFCQELYSGYKPMVRERFIGLFE